MAADLFGDMYGWKFSPAAPDSRGDADRRVADPVPLPGEAPAAAAAAAPSSSSFTWPSVVMNTFDGLTVPWTMPRRWAAPSASRPGSRFRGGVRRARSSADQLVEGASFEKLADEKCLPAFVAGIVHGADMRMGHERGDPGFTMEAIERPGPGHLLGSKQLDRHFALEPQVAGAEYLGGTVAADRADQLVVGDAMRDGHAGPGSCAVTGDGAGMERRSYSALAPASGRKSASARAPYPEELVYSRRLVARSPLRACARATPRCASGTTGAKGSTPRCSSTLLELPGRRRARSLPQQRFPSQVNGTRPATVPSSAGVDASSAARAPSGLRWWSAFAARAVGPRTVRTSVESGYRCSARLTERLRLGPQPGERIGRRLTKPWHGGGRVRPGFDQRDDPLDLVGRARRREEERFRPGQVRSKSRGGAAKPARKRHVGGAPIQLTRLLGSSFVGGHLGLCRDQVEFPRPVLRPRELRRGSGGVARHAASW